MLAFAARFKVVIKALLVSLLLTSWGCTTPHPRSFGSQMPDDTRRETSSVAVIPSTAVPANNFIAFKSQITLTEVLTASPYIARFAVSVATCPPCAVILLPFAAAAFGIGLAAQHIDGALNTVPTDDVKKTEAAINGAIAELNIQDNLASRIVSAGSASTHYRFSLLRSGEDKREGGTPSFPAIRGAYADIIISLNVKSLGFLGGKGADPAIFFFMNVEVRAVRTKDGAEIYSDNLSHISIPRKVSEWTRDGAVLLLQELKSANDIMAEEILENIFFVQDFHVASAWSGALHCMLKPYNPPLSPFPEFASHRIRASQVDSLQPTFRWEAFPRDSDRKSDATGMLARISEITYDLKIWRGHDGHPDALVYWRRGISAPERAMESTEPQNPPRGQSATAAIVHKERSAEHKIEVPLEPSTEYFWSVRARFKLAGQTRVTRWSYSRIPWQPGLPDPCLSQSIPQTHYLRFKTPEKETEVSTTGTP